MSMDFFKSLNEAKLHSRLHFEGLDISIEVPAGGARRGVNKKTGDAWEHKIKDNYGYIKGTHSPDGEHLDCYLRKNPKRDAKVYVVHQLTVDGSRFDEDKVMLGYSSKAEAVKAFKEFTFKPNTMYGGVTEFDMEHFQVLAYQASNSSAMLTNEKTYKEFKSKGLITTGVKSPLMVARKVSESLSLGLNHIAATLDKGDLQECLEWGGLDEGADIETLLSYAWGHYNSTPYMHYQGKMTEEEFRDTALQHVMETDALLTDVEDEVSEDLEEDIGLDSGLDDVCLLADIDQTFVEQEEIEEEPVMESNNFVVVVHTQIMENIGSAENPSWATAGTETILVQEGFGSYGDARSIAAKVAAGEVPVTLSEGAYVLGIDVLPDGEYRQFYEAVEEDEVVEEDTTEEVFFQQQVMEAQKLAGIKHGIYENKGTPTVHETRARLEALSKGYFEAVAEQELEEMSLEEKVKTSPATVAQALRMVRETVKKNPKASIHHIIRAVVKKHYNDDQDILDDIHDQAVAEYGSIHELHRDSLKDESRGSPIVKTKYI